MQIGTIQAPLRCSLPPELLTLPWRIPCHPPESLLALPPTFTGSIVLLATNTFNELILFLVSYSYSAICTVDGGLFCASQDPRLGGSPQATVSVFLFAPPPALLNPH